MGSVLEAASPFKYEHWMPDEEPTFYVPATVQLTVQQRRILQQTGFTQGEPFILNQRGRFSRPQSKKFALRGIKSGFSVQKDSVILYEEATGVFSLQFKYSSVVDVDIEIHCFAKDVSSPDIIKVRDTQLLWGPFKLASSTNSGLSCDSSNITSFDSAAESKPDYNCKGPSIMHNDNGAWVQQSSYRNADSTVHNRDDVFNSTRTSTAKGVYNTWKSRKVVNLQPSNHIDQAYLPSIAFNRKLQHVYDIVIIATPIVQCDTLAGSVAMEKSVEENAPVTSKDAEKTTLFGTRKKVIPSRKAEPGVSLPSYSLVESGGGDEGSSHLQNEVNVNAADYNSAAKSAGESTGDHDHHYNQVCDEEDVYPPGSSDAPSVQKEAYFFRINAESYAKRHQAAKTDITGTSNGSRKTRSSSTKARERTKSKKDINALVASSVMYSNTDDDVSVRKVGDQKTDENDLLSRTLLSADDKYAPKSSVFMRSRPIQLDCAMQLFQVQSGVYNRITLYGMEGFRLENIVPEQGEGSAQNSASDNMQNMQCIAQPDDINHNIDNNVEPLQQRAVPGNTSSSPSTTSSVQNNSNTLSTLAATSGERPGADCIICLSNKQTTIMFPCRHLCLCAECAKTIATRATASVDRANNRETVQEKKCPVCRKPVIVMFQLKQLLFCPLLSTNFSNKKTENMLKYMYEKAAAVGLSSESIGSIKTLLLLAAFWAVSVAFYSWYEGWTIGGSLTFVIVTMSTVGYGYDTPSDANSQLFTIFIMIFGSFGVYGAINHVVETRLEHINKAARIREKDMDTSDIYHRHHQRLMLNIAAILASLFMAAGAFSLLEDWTFTKGLYFAVQTATTVGFGDIRLVNEDTKKFIGFYIIASTVLMSCAFNNFKTLSAELQKLKEAAQFAKRKKALAKIKELDKGDGVGLEVFLLAVLEQLGTLDRERDLDPWIKKFKEIDTDNSGFIDSVEIEAFSAQERDLAAAQLAKLKNSRRGFSSKFSTSFNLPFNLGFADPLDDEDDDEDVDNNDAHHQSELDDGAETSDAGSEARGEHHKFGNFQFQLFGAQSRPPSATYPGYHYNHGHTGDMMPADLKQRSLTLSVDDVVMEEKEEGEGDGEGEMEYLHAAEGEGCV